MPSSLLQLADQLEDLRLDRDVERRGRLVGDQELRRAGERHRDHHALAHAAGELVRIIVDPLLRGSAILTRRSISMARSRASLRLAPRCSAHGFGDLVADGQDRIERGHRLLEDHRDLVAADAAHLLVAQRERDLVPRNCMLAADDAAGAAWEAAA